MMKHEFEALAGYEVSSDDYNKIIEPMYMAVEMSKQEFVKCIDKKRFALRTKRQLLKAMRNEAFHLAETPEHYTDFESKARLEELTKEYVERFAGGLDWYFMTETTGDRFWNAPGRGCSFPVKLITHHNNQMVEQIALLD